MPIEWFRALEDVLIPLVGMGMLTLLGTGVYRTIHRVMDRRAFRAGREELDHLRDELADLRDDVRAIHDHTSREISEIHERLDFTERLLAQPPHDAPHPSPRTPS